MKNKSTKSPFPWTSISVLLFTAAMLTAVILLYSSGQRERILRDAATEMEAVARLKAEQVAKWRSEKLNDARLIHENVTLVENIDAMFIKERPQWEKARLEQFLKTLIENYDFGGVVLVDAGGNPGLAVPASESAVGEFLETQYHRLDLQPGHLSVRIPHGNGGYIPSPRPAHPDEDASRGRHRAGRCAGDKNRSRKRALPHALHLAHPGKNSRVHPVQVRRRFSGLPQRLKAGGI
ncbi:MAG: hypothetical protein MZV63_59115 [Marinilabiliales bacterium]|nr:hypothetical protein [Marinilabiliales bacterium]